MIQSLFSSEGVRGFDIWRRNLGAWVREVPIRADTLLLWSLLAKRKLGAVADEFRSAATEQIRRENADAWDLFYEKATKWIDSTRADLEPREREFHIVQMAERFAIEELYRPPHWTGSTHCDECGYMPSLPGEIECQWCEAMP